MISLNMLRQFASILSSPQIVGIFERRLNLLKRLKNLKPVELLGFSGCGMNFLFSSKAK